MVRLVGAFPLALMLMLIAGAAVVQAADCGDGVGPCSCGDTVTSDTTLDASDPVLNPPACPGDGLTVDGVNLDLGGGTITGSNTGTGLILAGSGGSIANGRIRSFAVGIGSDGLIVDWTIAELAVSLNAGDGIAVWGDWNLISRLSCSRNGDDGLVVKGDHNTLQHNVCDKNGDKGIAVYGDYNTLVRNYGTGNLAGTGVLGIGDGNDFQTNRATNNGGNGVIGKGTGLKSNGRNYGTGNRGGTNCHIDGFPTTGGGRYC
jgi:hypothetical protein